MARGGAGVLDRWGRLRIGRLHLPSAARRRCGTAHLRQLNRLASSVIEDRALRRPLAVNDTLQWYGGVDRPRHPKHVSTRWTAYTHRVRLDLGTKTSEWLKATGSVFAFRTGATINGIQAHACMAATPSCRAFGTRSRRGTIQSSSNAATIGWANRVQLPRPLRRRPLHSCRWCNRPVGRVRGHTPTSTTRALACAASVLRSRARRKATH